MNTLTDEQGQIEAAKTNPDAETLPDPPSHADTLRAALAQMSHPGNLDMQSRLAAIEHVLRTLVAGRLQELSNG